MQDWATGVQKWHVTILYDIICIKLKDGIMPQTTFDEVLDAIGHLPSDQQAELLEVVKRRLAEAGRLRVAEEVRQAEAEFEAGNARATSVDEIMRGIES
jgi:hypothetical protein